MYFCLKVFLMQFIRRRLTDKDHRLEYCRNRGLIYAVALIGRNHFYNRKKSAYKNGIDYVCYVYNRNDLYRGSISKSEVRSVLRPNRKRRHELRITSKAIYIIDCISNIVNAENKTVRDECMAMNNRYAHRQNIKYLRCYRYLVESLIYQLNKLSPILTEGTELMNLQRQLVGNIKHCKYDG